MHCLTRMIWPVRVKPAPQSRDRGAAEQRNSKEFEEAKKILSKDGLKLKELGPHIQDKKNLSR